MTMDDVQESDDLWVPLSAIQHYSYCKRQYALIHVEQTFDENVYTMEGQWVHETVDEEALKHTGGVTVVTALPVWSDELALIGRCDVVEFHDGQPLPVEYKHGRLKPQIHDELQLCAQAMCLEEMFDTHIPTGVLYHFSSRHRREVLLSEPLRDRVKEITTEIRFLKKSGEMPAAVNDARCQHCSLIESCMPYITDGAGTKWAWQSFAE